MISEANGSTEHGGGVDDTHYECEFTCHQINKISKAGRLMAADFGPELLHRCYEMNPEQMFLQLDGFIHAIIGSVAVSDNQEVLVYSYARMVKILQLRDAMNKEDAEEFIEFNCSTYPGKVDGVFYPIIMFDC